MCQECFKTWGIGLGMGKGQEYVNGVKING